ncbi:hypothetical protein BATDEDRAFT_88385 [Batrachochytrium dendrobatidis JAM81]|uniref:Nucleolus and neural progenitor protein-like N-terminal domain-containing protein n=1 Tax=Batrachochytrium dendrobatidis (strain JAM81 / FGSC 10211) TaxID=684364 RepID=F4P182_BATDJ|nr:uncharacterized protein BATDEDRAFT_88385 [Batrachochytrium dendrobatidis JAM81]EGF80699.1 hypothetical protein BATDEDRAFT_88385 [Batrachochytrium dendrobatidis JAM81]|eukprot:XP_006678660.1 hypothetical protein BATDEDRAFT_88385 [Batrachochytrium dendrobatidis JAM81]
MNYENDSVHSSIWCRKLHAKHSLSSNVCNCKLQINSTLFGLSDPQIGKTDSQIEVVLTTSQAALLSPYRNIFAAKRLWREFALFDRLRSKSMNQHRSSVHLRKTVLTKRLFVRLKQLELESLIVFPDKKLVKLGASFKINLFPVMLHLAGAYALLCKIRTSLEDLFLAYRDVASQTYFMPTSLTFSAISARLHFLTTYFRKQCESCYDLAWSWTQSVPHAFLPWYASQLPPNLASLEFNQSNVIQSEAIDKLPDYKEAQNELDEDTDEDSSPRVSVVADTDAQPADSLSDRFWNNTLTAPSHLEGSASLSIAKTALKTADTKKLEPFAKQESRLLLKKQSTAIESKLNAKIKTKRLVKPEKVYNDIDDIFDMF